jgi:hypothetical protein
MFTRDIKMSYKGIPLLFYINSSDQNGAVKIWNKGYDSNKLDSGPFYNATYQYVYTEYLTVEVK